MLTSSGDEGWLRSIDDIWKSRACSGEEPLRARSRSRHCNIMAVSRALRHKKPQSATKNTFLRSHLSLASPRRQSPAPRPSAFRSLSDGACISRSRLTSFENQSQNLSSQFKQPCCQEVAGCQGGCSVLPFHKPCSSSIVLHTEKLYKLNSC